MISDVAAARFIHRVRFDLPAEAGDDYTFSLPVVAWMRENDGLELGSGATFLVGENGSGKSTVIEAIAVAAGFNPEGGSNNFRFHTRATESNLGRHVRLVRGTTKPRTGFFLRAESYYNVASEIERLEEGQAGLIDAVYGGRSPHEQSHGESFLSLVVNRFGSHGLYLLDEPEAALSVRGCMAALARIAELTQAECQFIIATHSPILLSLPGARILQVGEDGTLSRVSYDDALPVQLTREFLAAPQRFLRHLL
jgi:predicted ATPase